MYRLKKKKVPRSKNIQPNVSAYNYNNGVPPHPMEARSMKQVHGSKKQKPRSETINSAVKKKSLGPAQIHAGPKKISPQGPENTGTSSTFFCAPRIPQVKKKSGQIQKTCTGQKKRCPGPKNMQPIKISCFCCVHVHFFSLTLCITVAQCFFQHMLRGPVIF